METPSKFRVVFDRKVLNKYQRKEGLKRSWVFLRPNIKTISDLRCHVQKSFCLDKKCPNGVVLYIDGFALPPFEPTCMLHENDIITVRKKDYTQTDSVKVGDKPLAITEAGENSNGRKRETVKAVCMHNEDDIHTDSHLNSKKKRKHSDKIPSSKVRKKDNTQTDSVEVGDKPLTITEAGENSYGQKRETGKALCIHNDEKGIHTESHLNSKNKRKHSDEIPSLNVAIGIAMNVIGRKKKLKTNPKKPIGQAEDEDIVEKVVDYQSRKKNSNCSSKDDKLICSPQRVKLHKTVVDNVVGGSTHDHANGNVAKKKPSRNACRKKEKRIWLRELKAQNKQNDNQQFGTNNKLVKQQETTQNTGIDKETAPPAPSDRQWQTREKPATDNWNRPANKKNQNNGCANQWNQSNAPSNHQYCNRNQKSRSKWSDHTDNGNQNYARSNLNKWNNANGHRGQKWNWSNKKDKESCNGSTSKWSELANNKEQCSGNTSKWDDAGVNYEQSNEEIVPLNEKEGSSPIDFESLFPLTRIPQVGDLIAYCLIEMSPSWCPSITPYRIGEVASYNYLTLSIVLVPVPDYPIFTGDTQLKSSLYKEDGTLQIHYPSLIDVRLFKAFDSFKTSSESFRPLETEKNTQKEKTAPVDKWELALANGGSNVKEIAAQPIENGNGSGRSTWDQIKRIIDEKRSENDQNEKDGWGEWTSNKSSPSKSWQNGCSEWNTIGRGPQRAARGRSMGPAFGSFGGGRGMGLAFGSFGGGRGMGLAFGSFRGGRGKGNNSKPSFGK